MKFIKEYEDLAELKKYVVWKGKDPNIYIFEILFKFTDDNGVKYRIDHHYTYNKYMKKLDIDNIYNDGSISYIKHHEKVLYTSNDIKECIDMIPLLINANKYNL